MLNFVEWYIDYLYKQDEIVLSKQKAIEMLEGEFWHLINDGKHYGDCTNQNVTCTICYFETLLHKYYLYSQKFKNK